MHALDPVIRFQDVSVRYRLPRERVSGLKEYAIRLLQRRLAYEEFWALKDVSFQVQRGEMFGVIGRNGSGKSTLLKVIARVLTPIRGRVVVRGHVAPLLELGAGFHPELTGRENVYLNSALLGRTRAQVDEMLPEIVAFAEIEEFIEAPLRTYSTGMVARLGFAVATAARPDILLVDEVLSVGDAAFQEKCLDRMYSFQERGTTIVLVSHSMAAIESFCKRALWLKNGQVQALGDASEVTERYVGAGAHLEEAERAVEPLPAAPIPEAEPVEPEAGEYVHMPASEHVYPAEPHLNVRQGAVSVWLRFRPLQPQRTAILFHSDDSRYVLYTEVEAAEGDRPRRRIVARAGGNRRALETYYGRTSFPEVKADLEAPEPGWPAFPYGEWHLVTMTWDGYPEGKVQLYLDDTLLGESEYDRRHDNHYRLPNQFAVGIRPPEWVGEMIQREDGSLVDLRPQATLTVSDSGQEIRGMRLYPHTLDRADLEGILANQPVASG